MTAITRRSFIGTAAVGTALAGAAHARLAEAQAANLTSLTTDAQPITPAEHAARIGKLQSLMQREKVAALLVEAGSGLEYFTGIRWWRSERTTAAIIPAMRLGTAGPKWFFNGSATGPPCRHTAN